MLLLDNPVQRYAWGRTDGLARLVGTAPSGGPEAELWVGTHPRGSSVVASGPLRGMALAQVVSADPVRWLGERLAGEGARALPFLLKVLAIGEPLSLQAHPSADQARVGFAREESAGIPVDADERSYRDRSAKPEMLVAIDESFALCGFRDPAHAADLVERLGDAVVPMTGLLRVSDDPLQDAVAWLLQLDAPGRRAVAAAAASAAASAPSDPDDPWAWVRVLAARYPDDPTCLAPLLLHLLHLEPGDPVHLPAGNLHAYLTGAGIEVMAASDNVLRGGLTPKHVDVAELLHVLRFEPGAPARPRTVHRGDRLRYDAGEDAFALTEVRPGLDGSWISVVEPSLLLPLGQPASAAAGGEQLEVGPGQAVLVEPGSRVLLRADGPVWWATTGRGAEA
ncbi:MAG: mannose-6-phosphate isomerase, class I [Acidimicrobiales bacterium]